MTAGPVAGLEQLPEQPKAVSWTDGNWFQLVLRQAWSATGLALIAVGLLVVGLAELPAAVLFAYLVAWLVFLGVWAVLVLDGQNAAGPGWLASRRLYRWRLVSLDGLVSVRKLAEHSFRLKDGDGGSVVLTMTRVNAGDVLNVIRKDLARARKRGVRFPDELSAFVDGRVQ